MDLIDLDDLINNLGIEPTDKQIDLLFATFKKDFIDHSISINGLKVKVILKNSKVNGYERFPETFVHLITRKSQSNKRVFDRNRANKIHWVRCILENRNEEEIIYFEYPEDDGSVRDYYWYQDGDFLVIMEKITPDYLIITSFHIDNRKNQEFFEKKFKSYKAHKK